MLEVQNKIVSIETFRAMRLADRPAETLCRAPGTGLSQRSIEHRERMLRFLRTEALQRKQAREAAGTVASKDAREVQGRLLL